MKKVIGLICEGPRDVDLFTKVIDNIFPEEDIMFRYIQPEEDSSSQYYTGWKGVWRWCEEHGPNIDTIVEGIFPKIDLLIVHMDGDVSRKEKVSHCGCNTSECENKGCSPYICNVGQCPIVMPCECHGMPPESYVIHLKEVMESLFAEERRVPIVYVFPCDSTDAWIVSALDDVPDVELHNDPWDSIIAKRKTYHGVRISGRKKHKQSYEKLINLMIEKWDRVVEQCNQAKNLQSDLESVICGISSFSE